ncbi:MAG: hypothetical protein ACRCZO_13760 [Cetobacterium sp.]|uniref:hypothetical protein n=1 Tax=Cetobacterium sp. TaxID=2071632 RepID=UPI003F339CE7
MSTNRKFSIFYFFIIAVFIAISFNLRSKEKNKTFGLFPIVNNTKTIDQSNLTPAEKIVWENFKTIPKAEYKKRYKEIAESIRPTLNSPTDSHIGITILNKIPKTTNSYPSKNRVEVMKHFHLAETYFLIKENSEALKTL